MALTTGNGGGPAPADERKRQKAFQADCRKLVKVLGSRPAPPVYVLEERYREVMAAAKRKSE